MAITSVSTSTFLADTINLIRDKIKNNVVDPLVATRPSGQRFCLTAYPKNPVIYPIVTVIHRGIQQPQRLGMGSESTSINMDIEIRIWARNVAERDELFDEVYNFLREDQHDDDTGLIASNLNGFQLLSAINVSEDGENGIKSKVCEYRFLFICE